MLVIGLGSKKHCRGRKNTIRSQTLVLAGAVPKAPKPNGKKILINTTGPIGLFIEDKGILTNYETIYY